MKCKLCPPGDFDGCPTHRDAEGPNEADGLGVLLRGLRRL